MSALSDVLSMLARDARRIAMSADAEVTTTTRAGVVSVRVTDGGVTLLSATLDTRPRVEAPRAELAAQLAAVTRERDVLRAQQGPLLDAHDALVAAAALPGAGASPEAMVAAVRAQGARVLSRPLSR